MLAGRAYSRELAINETFRFSVHGADVRRTATTDRIIREFFDRYGPHTRLAFRAAAQGEDWEEERERPD